MITYTKFDNFMPLTICNSVKFMPNDVNHVNLKWVIGEVKRFRDVVQCFCSDSTAPSLRATLHGRLLHCTSNVRYPARETTSLHHQYALPCTGDHCNAPAMCATLRGRPLHCTSNVRYPARETTALHQQCALPCAGDHKEIYFCIVSKVH